MVGNSVRSFKFKISSANLTRFKRMNNIEWGKPRKTRIVISTGDFLSGEALHYNLFRRKGKERLKKPVKGPIKTR